jgi:hypothetical protein
MGVAHAYASAVRDECGEGVVCAVLLLGRWRRAHGGGPVGGGKGG